MADPDRAMNEQRLPSNRLFAGIPKYREVYPQKAQEASKNILRKKDRGISKETRHYMKKGSDQSSMIAEQYQVMNDLRRMAKGQITIQEERLKPIYYELPLETRHVSS